MTEAATPFAKLDDLLAEFSAADTAVPQPQYPSAAERLAEFEQLKRSTDEWKRGIEEQLGPLWKSAEVVDQLIAEEEQRASIASARARHGLNGHTPDGLIGRLVNDPEALQILADQDAKLAEAERAIRNRNDVEAAILSTRGMSHYRSDEPEYSSRQLSKMDDRQWEEYKARRLVEDAPAHAAWMGGNR